MLKKDISVEYTFDRLRKLSQLTTLAESVSDDDIPEMDTSTDNFNIRIKCLINEELVKDSINVKLINDVYTIRYRSLLHRFPMIIRYGIFYQSRPKEHVLKKVLEVINSVSISHGINEKWLEKCSKEINPARSNENTTINYKPELISERSLSAIDLSNTDSIHDLFDVINRCLRLGIPFSVDNEGRLYVPMIFPELDCSSTICYSKKDKVVSKSDGETYTILKEAKSGSAFKMSNVFSSGKPCIGSDFNETVFIGIEDGVAVFNSLVKVFFTNLYNNDLLRFEDSVELYGIRR